MTRVALAVVVLLAAPLRATAQEPIVPPAPAPAESTRGVLVPLYASFAALQTLDVHSTWRALAAGGAESNPLMRGIGGHPAALSAVKAAAAISTIVLVEKLRVKNRAAAIVLMVALNSTYAAIVAHNYRAARR